MNVHRSESVSLKDETVAAAAAKSAFPISVSGGLLFGAPISVVVQWATLIFVCLQIIQQIPRLVAMWHKWRDSK